MHPTLTAYPAPSSRPAPLPPARPVAALPPVSQSPAVAQPSAAKGPVVEPAQLWPALMAALATRPWMSWVEALEMRDWSGSLVKVGAKAGRHDVLKTISPQRREQLGEVLTKIAGRPISVELLMPAAPTAAGESNSAKGAAEAATPGRTTSKQQAMSLPLVRQVMEVFNATLVEFRPIEAESKATPAAETPGETTALPGAGGAPPGAARRLDYSPGEEEGGESEEE